MKHSTQKTLWLGLALLLLRCSGSSDLAGGDSSQTGNSRVLGKIVDKMGASVGGVTMVLVPVDYNPADSASTVLLKDTSDVNGNYAITRIVPGSYNLQGTDSVNVQRMLIRNITIDSFTNSLAIPTDTLRNPGSLIVPLADTGDSRLYLQGTTLLASPRPIPEMAGFVLFDSLFAGSIPPVFVLMANETGTGSRIGGNSNSIIIEGDATAVSILPPPWSFADIGQQTVRGGAAFSNGTFVLTGPGPDTGKTSDDLLFVEQPMTGDVELVVRLVSIENTGSQAVAGLMFRDSLTGGSRFLRIECSAAGTAVVTYRLNDNDTITAILPVSNSTYPSWFRLKRRSNNYDGSVSPDGQVWTSIGAVTLALSQNVRVGVYASSRNAAKLCSAVFDSVSAINQ